MGSKIDTKAMRARACAMACTPTTVSPGEVEAWADLIDQLRQQVGRLREVATSDDRVLVSTSGVSVGDVAKAMREKGIIDCTGAEPVVRKVLGNVPVTRDGAVIGWGSEVFWIDDGHHCSGVVKWRVDVQASIPIESYVHPSRAYSSEEAAQSALTNPGTDRDGGKA